MVTPPDNIPPVADAGGPYASEKGEIITFDASASYDEDGEIDFYRWNFGDGTSELLAEIPTHTYTKDGIYTITLTVADGEAQPQATATMYIDVEVIDDVINGYLYDEDSDGTYDGFYNYETEQKTPVEKTEDGKYLINSDGEGDYDYIYNPADKTLEEYSAPSTGEGEEDNTLLYIAAIIGILVIIGIFYAATRKGGKKPEPPKKKSKK